MDISNELKEKLIEYQRTEITESEVYSRLAKIVKSDINRSVLARIAADEQKHYNVWKKYTGQEVQPDAWMVNWYYFLSRVFGFTFGIKLMERGEQAAEGKYHELVGKVPGAELIALEENEHEAQLIGMLDEDLLNYAGSVVLGLNDALVELTGALAGLTLALQNTELIALSGSITGIAAAFSMAASEYLSTKSEKTNKHPVKAAIYTGIAYILTVLALIFPYLFFQNYYLCLAWSLTTAVVIIAIFNFYISVAKDEPFKGRFLEMAGLSLGVAMLSFFIGFLLRNLLGIEV